MHLMAPRSKDLGGPQTTSALTTGRCPRSPLLGGLHAHRQRGHGSDSLGLFVLALLGLNQRVASGGGEPLQGAPVLACGRARLLAYGAVQQPPRRGAQAEPVTLSRDGSQGITWLQTHRGWGSSEKLLHGPQTQALQRQHVWDGGGLPGGPLPRGAVGHFPTPTWSHRDDGGGGAVLGGPGGPGSLSPHRGGWRGMTPRPGA